MPINVTCPNCQSIASLPDSAAGKNIKCGCGQVFAAQVKASASSDDLLALQPVRPSASGNSGQHAPQFHQRLRSSRTARISSNRTDAQSSASRHLGPAVGAAVIIAAVAIMFRHAGSNSPEQQTASIAPVAPKPSSAPAVDNSAELERNKQEQQAADDAKRKSDAEKARQVAEERKRQDDERAAKQKKDAEARRQEFADTVATLAKAATVEFVTEESEQEKVISEERVYFPGFNTPAHSAEEMRMRQQQIYTQYPYADGQRRYKIVAKKAVEKVRQTFLHISIRNPSRQISLNDVLVIGTIDEKPFDSLDFDLTKELALPTGELKPGQEYEFRCKSNINLPNAYLVINGGPDGYAAVKVHGPTLMNYARAPVLFEKVQKLVAQVDAVNARKKATAWRYDRDAVADRFVQRLVDAGQVISAKKGDEAPIGNLLNYVFVFETEAGLQRTNRRGSVDLEQYDGQWIVRRVNIDGREQIVNWPDD